VFTSSLALLSRGAGTWGVDDLLFPSSSPPRKAMEFDSLLRSFVHGQHAEIHNPLTHRILSRDLPQAIAQFCVTYDCSLKIFYCFLKTSFNKLQRDTVSRSVKSFNELNYAAFSFSAGREPAL